MHIVKFLRLVTLVFSLVSFVAMGAERGNVSSSKADEVITALKGKPKKKFAPPKKKRSARTVAATHKKKAKLSPKRAVASRGSAKKASARRVAVVSKKAKVHKNIADGDNTVVKKRYASARNTKEYAARMQEDTEDDDTFIEEPEGLDMTDIAVPMSRRKAGTQQQKVLLDTAFSYLGTPYRHAGVTRNGMDCSGFVSTAFKSIDISLSRSSQEMATQGRKIDLEDIQVGDLLFFKTERGRSISHVGLVVDIDGDIKFIHSSSRRGVVISSLSEEYYQKTFRLAKRVM